MTPINADDLPPEVRRRLLEAQEGGSTPKRDPRDPEPANRAVRASQGPRYRCHECGEIFERWGAKAERHTPETGHSRFDAILHAE